MKILIVLALLFSLCCAAYQDFTYTSVANSTQCYSTYYPDSPGTCTFDLTYTSADTTLKGTFTCTNLKGNVSAAHFHDVGTTSSLTYNTGSVITDCVITVNADMVSGSCNCVFTTTTTMDALCADQLYLNYHTAYDSLGEVRSNLVSMAPLCHVKGGVALDGTVVIVTDAPTTGVTVDSFYIGGQISETVGGGYFYVSWIASTQTVIVSGILYGQPSSISTIYIYYPLDGSSSLGLYSYYTFPSDCPFSFKSYSISLWTLAKLASGLATINVTLTDGTMVSYSITSSKNFPQDSSPCRPYVSAKLSSSLTCQNGYTSTGFATSPSDYDCTDITYYCGVYPYSDYNSLTCTYYSNCYECDCTASESDLPLGGAVCCDTTNCNLLGFSGVNCFTGQPPSGSAGNLSVGFLISLFVVVFMKWFN